MIRNVGEVQGEESVSENNGGEWARRKKEVTVGRRKIH